MRRTRLALLAAGLALSIWSNALALETRVIDDPAKYAEEMHSWGIVASGWDGIELDVYGNGKSYSVHLRSDDTLLPWQSYRKIILAQDAWKVIRLAS